MSTLTEVSKNKSFGGWQKVFSHESSELKCKMNFGVYLPPQAETGKVPVLYFLSGLTCTEQNFIAKSGFQNYAAKHGVCVVNPDTSPRGCNIEGEEDSWDFGTGAGFYVDATEEKWKTNYRMYSYVTKELPELIKANFPVNPDKKSIVGHSMGGHGALSIYLKNPGMYSTVSAFSPICNPIECPWGQKAFAGYLGDNKDAWKEHDSCHLLKKYTGPKTEILIYQGAADNFLSAGQLLPDHLVAAGAEAGVPVKLHLEEGYDHSYFFISSFIEETFNHHAKYLKA